MGKTQNQKILEAMAQYPNDWFLASDFQRKSLFNSRFIGYEAGPRLSTLAKINMLDSRRAEKKNKIGQKYKEWRINENGLHAVASKVSKFTAPYRKKHKGKRVFIHGKDGQKIGQMIFFGFYEHNINFDMFGKDEEGNYVLQSKL